MERGNNKLSAAKCGVFKKLAILKKLAIRTPDWRSALATDIESPAAIAVMFWDLPSIFGRHAARAARTPVLIPFFHNSSSLPNSGRQSRPVCPSSKLATKVVATHLDHFRQLTFSVRMDEERLTRAPLHDKQLGLNNPSSPSYKVRSSDAYRALKP